MSVDGADHRMDRGDCESNQVQLNVLYRVRAFASEFGKGETYVTDGVVPCVDSSTRHVTR